MESGARDLSIGVPGTCAAELIQASFRQLTFCSAAILLYEGYQNVGEKSGPLSGRGKPWVFFQTSAEHKLFCTHELRSAARACRRVCTLKIPQSKPRARAVQKS